jgi:hypothetical protein
VGVSAGTAGPAEVHLFALWSHARTVEKRILSDIAEHFRVLDVVEVTWASGDSFSQGLSRMYGTALPPGSHKEVHCGAGPFLVVVVEVDRPRYRPRRVGKRLKYVNAPVFDARRRYRQWTGGGHRVHASDSMVEADRNLALLFGRTTAAYRDRNAQPVWAFRSHAQDPVGTHGWDSVGQLLLTLGPYGNQVVDIDDGLVVRTSDLWWAEQIAGGRAVADGVRELKVGGESVRLTLLEEPAERPAPLPADLRRVARAVRFSS